MKTILAIDDDPSMRDFYEQGLAIFGYNLKKDWLFLHEISEPARHGIGIGAHHLATARAKNARNADLGTDAIAIRPRVSDHDEPTRQRTRRVIQLGTPDTTSIPSFQCVSWMARRAIDAISV